MNNWLLIDQTAANLGVSEVARAKWRVRNRVPHHWRLPILEALMPGRLVLTAGDFDKLRQPPAAERVA